MNTPGSFKSNPTIASGDFKVSKDGGGLNNLSTLPSVDPSSTDAALVYWRKQNGNGPVETKVTYFGCHIQVDIMSNNRIAKSLRYQNGTITEM